MSSAVRSARRENLGLLAVLYALLVFALFPGRFDADSVLQYYQGVTFTLFDWLSPLMSLLLGILRPIAAGPAPMFIVQLTLYFLGVLLLSDSIVLAGHRAAGQALSLLMLAPIVSFNFLDIQKDAMFCALTVLAIGICARSIVAPRPVTVVTLLWMVCYLTFMLDLRKNSVFMLIPICFGFAYFVCRLQSHLLRAWAVAALLLGGAFLLQQVIVYNVLLTRQGYALSSVILYDMAGISSRSGDDVSLGLVGPGFLEDAQQCYTRRSADNLMPWGACKTRGVLLQQAFETPEGRRAAVWTWIKAIARHPLAYAGHRWAHFAALMRISCDACTEPMNPGVRVKRPYNVWQPTIQIDYTEPERVTVLGLMLERLAMMSYASAWSWGYCWMALLAAGMISTAISFRRGTFDQFDVLTAIVSAAGFVYGAGFLIVGVSDALRYLHVVFALGLATIGLFLRHLSRFGREAGREVA